MRRNGMSLEEFLWAFADDAYQIIRVLIYGETIKITNAFDIPLLEVLAKNGEFESLLKHAVKSVRACGSDRGEGHALEITVWDHGVKSKEKENETD